MSDATPTPEPVVPVEAPEAPAPRLLPQEDVDRIVQERLARERAKYADYDDLKVKAAKLGEFEAERMTETEKLTKERDDALTKVGEFDAREKAAENRKAQETAAMAAAKKLGYPSLDKALSLAKFIEGDDLTASAESLFEDFKPTAAGLPGAINDVTTDPDEGDPIKRAFRAGLSGGTPPPK